MSRVYFRRALLTNYGKLVKTIGGHGVLVFCCEIHGVLTEMMDLLSVIIRHSVQKIILPNILLELCLTRNVL